MDRVWSYGLVFKSQDIETAYRWTSSLICTTCARTFPVTLVPLLRFGPISDVGVFGHGEAPLPQEI